MTTTPVMSCAPIYQIEATGLLPKHSGRMATMRLSLLPAFMQQTQPASSAVVLSYMLLGKDHRGRGSQTIKTELNLSGFSVNQCDLPICGAPEVSVEPLIVKPQLERLECRGLVNKPTNDSSISPSHHTSDDMSKQTLTVAHATSHQKHSPE